jgi:hypothetical protein
MASFAPHFLAAFGDVSWIAFLITGLLSGTVMVFLHHSIALGREQAVLRRAKLEELHRAVFQFTSQAETWLRPLEAALTRWRELELEQKAGQRVRGETLEACRTEVHARREAVRREGEVILDNLEAAIRLISIYFPEFIDARPALASVAREMIVFSRHAKLPMSGEFGESPEPLRKICSEVEMLGQNLTDRIWNLEIVDGKMIRDVVERIRSSRQAKSLPPRSS